MGTYPAVPGSAEDVPPDDPRAGDDLPRHRPFGRWKSPHGLSRLLPVAVVFLLLISGLATAGAGAGGSSSSTSPSTPGVAISAAPSASPPGSEPGTAGSTPATEAPASPLVAHALQRSNYTHPVFPVLNGTPESPIPGPQPFPARPAAVGLSSSPPAVPALSVPTGYVTGTVVDSLPPHLPVAGASVTATPLAGYCPSQGCATGETDTNGQFTILAPVGENYIEVSDAFYMTNRTWAFVSVGATTDVGVLELVHDGFVTGTVRADDPAHQALSAISIAAQTLDGTFQAFPIAHTNATGQFTVAVPPVPSYLTFTPIFQYAPYEGNHTWVNVSAGATLDVGTVYLEVLTPISVEVVDATTGSPISGGLVAIQVTSDLTQYQPDQGTTTSGPLVVAEAPAGPDSVEVYAQGYMTDTTNLGIVPTENPGTGPVYMGEIRLVPIGVLELNVGIIGGIPSAATSQWPLGQAIIQVCSIDSAQTGLYNPFSGNFTSTSCTSGCDGYIGQPVELAAIPLRDYITVVPDTSATCNGFSPTWPIPGDLPVFENWAWANITPDRATNIGHLDLLPGTYVQGQVLPRTAVGWTVTACSTDEPTTLCAPGVDSEAEYLNSFGDFVPSGCDGPTSAAASYTFCVPVPPGAFRITVTAGNATTNYTWAYAPPFSYTQMPIPLRDATQFGVTSINVTAGRVWGYVLQARSLTPLSNLPVVQACPAGTAPAAVLCGTGVVGPTGYFAFPAPKGLDRITVSASNYVSNSTWVTVGANSSAGTVLMTPFGYVRGQVFNTQGQGIYSATVQICPVTNPGGCRGLGANGGLTSTDGSYFGSAVAGSLPLGAYQVQASAPGYESDWTWVNVTTPGQNFTAPSIYLRPLPSNATSAATSLLRGATLTAWGAWVAGRVTDAADGIGLPDAAVSVLNLAVGGAATSLSPIRGSGGEFNDSLPIGVYRLTASLAGFVPQSVTLNVSGNLGTIDLGTFALTPFPRIAGRLVIAPWNNSASFASLGLGPDAASVEVCAASGSPCGPTATADTSGSFNVSAPPGVYDVVYASGTGSGQGTVQGGYVANQTEVNVSQVRGLEGPPLTVGLGIYGAIVGTLAVNGTGKGTVPVRYDNVAVSSNSPVSAVGSEQVNATGQYTLFFPDSYDLNVTAGGLGAWIQQGRSFVSPQGTNVTVLSLGNVTDLDALAGGPSFRLIHYGYLDAQIDNNATGAPIPYAGVATSENGTLWGVPTTWSTSGVANGGGYLNLTAPPSIPASQLLLVNVSAPDYSYQLAHVRVNSSKTSYLNGTGPNSTGFTLAPWGWVAGTALDLVTHRPVVGANPVVASQGGLLTGASAAQTNGAGYFVVDGPPGPSDHLSVALPGYSTNNTYWTLASDEFLKVPTLFLTGDGVVQGRVTAYPSGAPVLGATVSVCPRSQANCVNSVSSNASGLFAIAAVPGTDSVTVSAPGFVSSAPAYVRVYSDTWSFASAVVLDEYAYIDGTALGVPGGLALADANASLCAPSLTGVGAGPCFVTVNATSGGAFSIRAAAGNYVLEVSAPFFNATYLPIATSPGEILPVGTIFLSEYGIVDGTVVGADTGLPLPGARVMACEAWGNRSCVAPTAADAYGHFVTSGPPGPFTVEITATGYLSSFSDVVVVSGGETPLGNVSLIPIGPGFSYSVSGTVVSVSNRSQGLAGAIVASATGQATTAGPSGAFALTLPWGRYTLTAQLPGYLPSSLEVNVTGPVGGLTFALAAATFSVSGVVRDGLTGTGLSGVHFRNAAGGSLSAVSGAQGRFAFQLPNGTYSLVASPSAAVPPYADVPFVVSVDGRPVVRNLTAFPVTVAVDGIVVGSLTGVALAGVTVTVNGTTLSGIPWSTSITSGPDGRFVLPTYPGSYSVSALAAGYRANQTALTVPYVPGGPASLPLTISLTPATASAPAASSFASSLTALAVAVGLVTAGGVAALLLSQRRGRSGRGGDVR